MFFILFFRFQFLKDSPHNATLGNPSPMTIPVQCRSNDYIHASGSVFVQIAYYDKTQDTTDQNTGFNLAKNFTLTKKWRSSATGDAEFVIKFIMEFEDFCSNTNGNLQTFCEQISPDIERTLSQIKPDSSI